MQIGQGGTLPASSGLAGARPDAATQRPDRPHAGDAARAAQRRVDPVGAGGEPPAVTPRRNLPRGTLINIRV